MVGLYCNVYCFIQIEFANSSEILSYMVKLLSEITDKMDVVYIPRIMESISKQVKVDDKVSCSYCLSTLMDLRFRWIQLAGVIFNKIKYQI